MNKLKLLFVFIFCLAYNLAEAKIIPVVNLNDSGNGSLRYAINIATPGDTVLVDVSGTISLDSPILINGKNNLTILGPYPKHNSITSSATWSGGNSLFILQNSNLISINQLGFIGGVNDVRAISIENTSASTGSPVKINRCLFEFFSNGGLLGGAISTLGFDVDIRRCSFISNNAGRGGALNLNSTGVTRIVNCTFWGNTSAANGGAVYAQGVGSVGVMHNTFYENDSNTEQGEVIYAVNGTQITMQNNAGAGNSTTDQFIEETAGTFSSAGGNRIKMNYALEPLPWTQTGSDFNSMSLITGLRSSVLEDGFGLKYFTIVDPSSQFIDIGNSSGVPETDMRRAPRILYGGINAGNPDAGACEFTVLRVDTTAGALVTGSLANALTTSYNALNYVEFDIDGIGPHEILPTNIMSVTGAYIIDAYSQPGSAIPGPEGPTNAGVIGANIQIEINNPGGIARAFDLNYGGTESIAIQGLRITGFDQYAIFSQSSNVRVFGNEIGITAANNGNGNGNAGVFFGGSNCDLGGIEHWQRNVVSANGQMGNESANVYINAGSSNNRIVGNIIGVAANGIQTINGSNGIYGVRNQGFNTLIGANTVGGSNIIGQNNAGVFADGCSDLRMFNNKIGVGYDGITSLGNLNSGIDIIFGGTNLQLGKPGKFKNVISGNGSDNIRIGAFSDVFIYNNIIGLDSSGSSVVSGNGNGIRIESSTATNINIGGTTAGTGNIISGNFDGIYVSSCGIGVVIRNNYIGTDGDGLNALGNTDNGIELQTAVTNPVQIGTPGSGNVISGNQGNDGIRIFGTENHFIQSNIIGLDKNGDGLIPNGSVGINVVASDNLIIGGTLSSNEGNVISGNAYGIFITSGDNNQIQGNYIGLDITGSFDRGNSTAGIQVANTTNTTIGGNPTLRNVIGGSSYGIVLNNGGTQSLIASNLIGCDATGTNPIPNNLGGIYLNNTHESQVGGSISSPDMRNYIVASTVNGILIQSPNSTIEGNVIGLGLGNVSAGLGNDYGIRVQASNVEIGPNYGSVISNNSSYGIELESADSCTIDNCIIGSDATSSTAYSNSVGIYIDGGNYNKVGSIGSNTIVANTSSGISVTNGSQFNEIVSNDIGDLTGSGTLDNANGILVNGNSHQNIIGGSIIGNGNNISGNANYGIEIINSNSNIIRSNHIGTDPLNVAAPNNTGIHIVNSNSTLIGGEDSNGNATYNIISSNTLEGIFVESGDSTKIYGNRIGTNVTGNGILSNNIGIRIGALASNTYVGSSGNSLLGNTVSGNTDVGILIDGASTTKVFKNKIGCDFTAVSGLGGQLSGIELINGATSNTIGGNKYLEGNIIGGNSTNGIVINGSNDNSVEGNIIGLISTNPQNNGVVITGTSTNNSIGTPPYDDKGNVISLNTSVGVKIEQSSGTNYIESNLIGLDTVNAATPSFAQAVGVEITNTAGINNYVGTNNPGGGNIISGNNVGVQINGASEQFIYNNHIGTDTTGMNAVPNTIYGVHLLGMATNNTIGGPVSLNESNLISGNITGVYIQDSGTQDNVLSGNIIGMDESLVDSLPNETGVVIDLSANLNSIGTTGAGNGNIISGNHTAIQIKGNASNNDVVNNQVGVQNSNVFGVVISGGANNNVIGGGNAEKNIISGNDSTGVAVLNSSTNSILGNYIGMEADGLTPLPNLIGVYCGNSTLTTIGDPNPDNGNLISANTFGGVILENSDNDNVIQNNLFGTDHTGNNASTATASPFAIYFTSSNSNTIGGNQASNEGNVICGNSGVGIFLDSSSNNAILGNNIGLSKNNSTYIGNGQEGILLINNSNNNAIGDVGTGNENVVTANLYGIHLKKSSGNTIANNFVGNDDTGGESTTPAGVNQQLIGIAIDTLSANNIVNNKNVISGNSLYGITIIGPGTNQNYIQDNHIGVDFSGSIGYPNDSINVLIAGRAKQNQIGGPSSTERNIIGGDANFQVVITNPKTDSNRVTGNYIGVGLDQTTTYNTLAGVAISDSASYNIIGGGNGPDEGNYIPTSNGFGIYLGERVTFTKIQGNKIGLKPNASNGSIDSTGIRMHGSDKNQIGGFLVGSDSANYITNCKTGVDLKTYPPFNSSYANAIIGNSIYGNQALGIDINADELILPIDTNQNLGNNGEIDRPKILTAWNCGANGNTHVGFEFYSNNAFPNYKVEFYSNSNPDPSGYGEGETYLGHWVFDPDTNVDTIDIDLGTSLPVGTSITATITGTLFNTSEFSENVTVSDPPILDPPTTVPESCLGAGNGEIQIDAPGAYYFSIDGGTSFTYGIEGDTLTAVAGSYTLMAEYLNGCIQTQNFVLDPGTALPFDTTVVGDTCGTNGGIIIVDTSLTNSSGGSGYYSFSYDNGMTFVPNDTASNLTFGTYNVVLQDDTLGCFSDTVAVDVPSIQPPPPTINTVKTNYCPNDTLQAMSVNLATNDTVNWYDNGNLVNVVATGSIFTPTSITAGDNYFYATYADTSGCESLPDSVNYTHADISGMYADSSRDVCIGSEIQLNAYGGVVYNWSSSPQITADLADSTTTAKIMSAEDFVVEIMDEFGCSIRDTISIDLLPADQCEVDVYNAFSPNGDGTNDYWEIDGIEGFPENTVLIYNRWGDVIMSFNNYDNSGVIWDGTDRNGKTLPAGTYFYVVEVGTSQNQAGWVQIVK